MIVNKTSRPAAAMLKRQPTAPCPKVANYASVLPCLLQSLVVAT